MFNQGLSTVYEFDDLAIGWIEREDAALQTVRGRLAAAVALPAESLQCRDSY